MVSREQLLNDLEVILTEKIGVELEAGLTEETNMLKDGLALDSVVLLEMIIELELQYDIEIDEDELNAEMFEELGNLIEFVQGKME